MGMVSESEKQNAMEIFDELGDSFNVMLGAAEGKLDTPVEIETSASGDDEAECLGSVRHIAEYIEETGHGYEVEVESLGETEGLPSNEVRFRYRLTVTED